MTVRRSQRDPRCRLGVSATSTWFEESIGRVNVEEVHAAESFRRSVSSSLVAVDHQDRVGAASCIVRSLVVDRVRRCLVELSVDRR